MSSREVWLTAFSKSVRDSIQNMGMAAELEADASLRLSCGFAPAQGKRKVASAVLLAPSCSADDSAELFVSPELADSDKVADAILPLIIQAHLGDWNGRMVNAFMRRLNLNNIKTYAMRQCGIYPHAEVVLPKRSTDGTRLLKVVCSVEPTNFVVRMSRKCLNVGTPVCPCHNERMVQA